MKPISALALAASAAAVVIPDTTNIDAWINRLPSDIDDAPLRRPIDDAASALEEDLGVFASTFENALSSAKNSFASAVEDVLSAGEDLVDAAGGHHDHDGDREHRHKTIYEIIKENEHTTKFAALVDEHDSVVKLLNSTTANYTLFVPVDSAFEHHGHGHGHDGKDHDHDDHDHEKPPPEVVERILKYHVGHGLYPAGRILATHTLPTELDEDLLGGRPQRLRTRVGLSGVSLNFYSRVLRPDVAASNGVVHAVDKVLVPPTFVGRELSLFPAQFSTLLLAYQRTDFVGFIHHVDMRLGSTVFAPSNPAWEKLGPAANAFLFNSEKGLGYLKALLKYHVVANSTLYSDAFYRDREDGEATLYGEDGAERGGDGSGDGPRGEGGVRHSFVVLPSLLQDRPLTVDIWRWGGFIDLKVNGAAHVAVQDGVAKNGVIHVVDSVPLPPKEPGRHGLLEETGGEIEVEDLIERLAPFVEEGEGVVDAGVDEPEGEWTDL